VSEPTSILTFRDLVIEVARKIGVASYGTDGAGEVAVPTVVHDLSECKRLVNNGIRMLYADGPPPNGWRFTRPTASIVIWADIAVDAANLAVSAGYDPATNKTTLTVTSDSFYATMEEKDLVLTGVGTFTIADYVSATSVKVRGDATAAGAAGVTWTLTADGNYTMPKTFSGQYIGQPTYAADTNQGISLEWRDESFIRSWRENVTDETGDPYWLAVRPMTTGTPRRRWELMAYPAPDETMTIETPLILHFDKLVDLDEVPELPYSHDETLKAACLATAEKDVEDSTSGPNWEYYRNVCLPNSYRIDALSAPKKLGYFGNPSGLQSGAQALRQFRSSLYQRPDVSVN